MFSLQWRRPTSNKYFHTGIPALPVLSHVSLGVLTPGAGYFVDMPSHYQERDSSEQRSQKYIFHVCLCEWDAIAENSQVQDVFFWLKPPVFYSGKILTINVK